MTDRVRSLQAQIQALNAPGVRRTLFYQLAYESLRQTEGEPVQLRRAKAEAWILEHAPLEIHPVEPIVGSMTALCPVTDAPAYDAQLEKAERVIAAFLEKKRAGQESGGLERMKIKTFEDEFTKKKSRWALMSRVNHDADISYQDLQSIQAELCSRYADEPLLEPYEIRRELERCFKIDYGEAKAAVHALPWFAGNHLHYNYASIMDRGFDALIAEITARLEAAKGDEQREFDTAVLIVARGAAAFFTRHADACRLAAREAGGERQAELLALADTLDALAHRPAQTFQEGVQFVWLLHMAASFLWGSALSFGRFDQELYPLYKKSRDEGMTQDEALELLCCLWLKINEPCLRTVQSLTVGGVTPEGADAVNELTYLCLKATELMKLPYPNVGARLHPKNPPEYLDAVLDCVSAGAGQPMILSDEVWIANMKRLGYPDRIANDYYNMGCVEIMFGGRQPNWGVTEPIAFPMLLEPVFAQIRAGTFHPATYEEFRERYLDELRRAVEADYREALAKQKDIPGKCYEPFGSLMIGDCLQRERDMFQGGAELGTHWSFYAYGLGTLADSLAAVKQVVYTDHLLSIEALAEALHENFRGEEALHQTLSTRMPHYGNDTDAADLEGKYVLRVFDDLVLSYNRPDCPEKYVSTLFGYFFHIYHGEITGATPNGRLRGEPFSDSMGPSQGKDVSGPTKLLNSALKQDFSTMTGGYALNVKINREHAQGARGRAMLTGLVRTYFDQGGAQLQIVFLDNEILRKAQKEPEKYANVVVRIGGYCEYFVNLDRTLQNEIIERTAH